ncbi:MAG: glycosyltransferase family 1 protein [Pseudomonadota bacterium]
MPRVLIDISRLLGRLMQGRLPTGVDRVGLAYAAHYRHSEHSEVRAVLTEREVSAVLSAADSRHAFDLLLSEAAHPESSRSKARRLVWKARLWSWMRNDFEVRGSILINTGHRGLEHPRHAQSLRNKGVRPVFFIHDLIPVTHPAFCRDGEQATHMARLRNAMAWGCGIITNSHDTRGQLLGLARAQGWPARPVLAAPLGSAALPRAPAARLLAADYFVMLGTIEPRKNHALMLDVWRQLAQRMQAACPTLVVIGQGGWKSDAVMAQLRSGALPHVMYLENCSDVALAAWLQHARALLFPSHAEGYGLPLVEALALNLPVVASDLPVFREIAGNTPDYASPHDGAQWLELVMDHAGAGSPRRAAQAGRIKGFRIPQWADHFAAVDRFIGDIAAQGAKQ